MTETPAKALDELKPCKHEVLQFHSGGHFVYCPSCRGWWTATTDGQHGTIDFSRANNTVIGGEERRSLDAPRGREEIIRKCAQIAADDADVREGSLQADAGRRIASAISALLETSS